MNIKAHIRPAEKPFLDAWPGVKAVEIFHPMLGQSYTGPLKDCWNRMVSDLKKLNIIVKEI